MARSRSAVLALITLTLLAGCRVVDVTPAAAHPAPGSRVTVPDVVGRRLSDAKSVLGGAGFTKINANDATSRDRVVIDPTNWVVVSETPQAGTSVVAGTAVTLAVRRPSDGAGPVRTSIGTVPGVVCMNLQDAQDALRQSGFLNLRSEDGSGKARYIILDRDWLVTAQSAKPGGKPSLLTRIVLTAVKYGEPTGSSGCKS